MRVATWRWLLVPMVIVVAGCVSQPAPSAPTPSLSAASVPAPSLPAAFKSLFSGVGNPRFRVQAPPAGQTGQDIAAALQAEDPVSFRGRAVPVYGFYDCYLAPNCSGGGPRWYVFFPDCGDNVWVHVDPAGVDAGFTAHNVCQAQPSP